MKVLILSCDTGQGHNSCAQALKEEFAAQGVSCVIEDALRFVSAQFSRIVSLGHVELYRHAPRLNARGYHYAQEHPNTFHRTALPYRILMHGAKSLSYYITENHFDKILCTHVFPGIMLNAVAAENRAKLWTGFVATDYTCSPMTCDSRLDRYYIAASALEEQFAHGNIERSQILASGIPVRKAFFSVAPKAEAKKAFGIFAQHQHLVIMCGSMGCGPIRDLVRQIGSKLNAYQECSVVCGTNKKLYQTLHESDIPREKIHILPYVEDMSLLMDSADLFLTKPGGISVTEAAVKRLPMVLVDAVAGCEEDNLAFFVQNKAAVTGQALEELSALTVNLLNEPRALAELSANLSKIATEDAAHTIFSDMYQSEVH